MTICYQSHPWNTVIHLKKCSHAWIKWHSFIILPTDKFTTQTILTLPPLPAYRGRRQRLQSFAAKHTDTSIRQVSSSPRCSSSVLSWNEGGRRQAQVKKAYSQCWENAVVVRDPSLWVHMYPQSRFFLSQRGNIPWPLLKNNNTESFFTSKLSPPQSTRS